MARNSDKSARWADWYDVVSWLDRWPSSESFILGAIAIAVGLTSGAGVWLFKRVTDLLHQIVFVPIGGALASAGSWMVFLLPVMGGLVVGLIAFYFVGPERYHGVAGIMEAVALAGGRLAYRRLPIKALVAALSIAAGASVGPEDPSVQIGANLGSLVGQRLNLSDERVRALVAAGAASGISAAFNAPIAGVFFALEVVLGELSSASIGVVALASVISAVFTQAVSGPKPAFQITQYAFNSAWELPLYLGLGLLAGPVAAAYIRLIYLSADRFHAWRVPRWLKPAVAGLLVGLVGLALPQVLGVGYGTIENILVRQPIPVYLLLAMLLAKIVVTPISVGGGFYGGVFAPSLFLGATLGAAYGELAQRLFPALNIVPAAFALVGMAAVLAGAVHAPLTAVILLFEMTNDYRIILPLMFAVAFGMFVSQLLQRDSVYMLGLARNGIRLQRGRDVEVMETLTVGEVMDTQVDSLRSSDSLKVAAAFLMQTRHHGVPVLNERDELVGIITLQDIDRGQNAPDSNALTAGDVCTHDLLIAFADETIGTALRRLSVRDVGRLPVVERTNMNRLVGVLRRTDVVRAYDVALTRRAQMRHRAHQVRLGAVGEVNVTEIEIDADSPCAGKRVQQIAWPHESVIATIRRGRHVLIPHGYTVIKPGDMLVVVAESEVSDQVAQLCAGGRDLRE